VIRAMIRHALVLAAACAVALTPVTCLGQSTKPLPAKATQELPPELLALLEQKKMPKYSPIVVRLFKEEAELEVWKQDTTGRFQILKTYPICRWSGDLGPKLYEGDRQAPEGFYTITPELMNPNSNYYLSINFGYPNTFDKANKRNGSFLMIHGDCWSAGCYAMTDEQISEIYSLARDALSGRPSFQVQAYPFRLTPANLARHRNSPNLAFWKMLKVGNDHFPGPGLSVPPDAGEPGAASKQSEPGLLENAQGRQRSFRDDATRTQGGCVQPPLCIRCATAGEFAAPSRVQPRRKMSPLRRQSGNRAAGAGEKARGRARLRATG
jgi:murein L,D-transpeptidase YafK